MQTFVIVIKYLWPADSGSRLRLRTAVHNQHQGRTTDVVQAGTSSVVLAER
jgi:hypothetical protein